MQVFLRSQTYEHDGTQGFLGLSADPRIDAGRAIVTDPDAPGTQISGANFVKRTPGFCGYQWLQDGDIILGFGEDEIERVNSFGELVALVKRTPAGTRVQLLLLRGGKRATVQFKLDARPAAAVSIVDGPFEQFLQERMNKFDAYWKENFAALSAAGVT